MNFDLDDPLGDLGLSDGSNDSFFETKKPVKTNTQPKTSTPKSKDKMADLFGIKQDKPSEVKEPVIPKEIPKSSGQSSFVSTKKEATPTKKTDSSSVKIDFTPKEKQKKDIIFDDDEDIIADLGFDPKKPKSKMSVLDDLLGLGQSQSTTTTFSKSPTVSATVRPKTTPAIIPKDDPPASRLGSRQSTIETVDIGSNDSNTNFGTYAPSSSVTRSKSGRRRSSTVLNDPLGLFSNELDNTTKNKTEEKKKKSGTADWLGLTDDSHVVTEQKSIQQPIMKPPSPLTTSIALESKPALPIVNTMSFLKPDPVQTSQILASSNIETENAIQGLKQQEIQLMVASQMRSQETALLDMQKRQKDLLAHQEIQFNELLQKQIQRQGILEENIRRQQERINSHIQIMLSQPSSLPLIEMPRNNDEKQEHHRSLPIEIEFQTDIRRLELEKLRLEDLLANINVNHEQEIVILEQSYKKQISLLDENLHSLELRLKTENKSLEEFYTKKINQLEDEKIQMTQIYEKNLKELEQNQIEIIKKMRNLHLDEIENIRMDHKNMIDNIRQSKLLEFSVIQENNSYIDTLKNASNYLENATGNLQTLRDHLEERIESVHAEKEIQLKIREHKVEEQQKKLDKARETTESERVRLLELVKSLETKLGDLNQTTSEEQWILRQKMASLEAEKTTFEREREFSRQQQIKEEQRVAELKQYQLMEYERLMTEKTKLETISRLNSGTENKTSRAEIEAAIKVAQDATKQSDIERERLLEQQRKYEIKKRELIDQENSLHSKENDLEMAINSARSRERSAELSIRSAKKSEQKVITKLQILQKSARDLTQRELTLSKDKLEISQERIELQTLRKKLYESRCSLCKIGEKSKELSDILTKSEMPQTMLDDLPKFDLENLNVNRLDQILDMEVASSLRRMEVNSMNNNDEFDDDFELNLNQIPNITDISDEFLDHNLLQLKFDIMKGSNNDNETNSE